MFKFTHAFNAAEISLIMKIACQNRLPPIAPDIIITRLASSENWNGRKRKGKGYFNFRLASDFFSSLSIHRFPIRPVFRDNNFSLRERVKKRVKKFHKDLISTNRTLVSIPPPPTTPSIYVGGGGCRPRWLPSSLPSLDIYRA